MTTDIHAQTRQYLDRQVVEDGVKPDPQLEAHLAGCESCAEYAQRLRVLLGSIGRLAVEPSSGLVERTQVRLRRRVRELEQQDARLRPLWIACVFSVVWTAFTMPFVWRGFEWLSARLRLASSMWELAFAVLWVLPGLAAAVVVLYYRPLPSIFTAHTEAEGEL